MYIPLNPDILAEYLTPKHENGGFGDKGKGSTFAKVLVAPL